MSPSILEKFNNQPYVVVVDDDPGIRRILTKLLSDFYNLFVTENPEEVIDFIKDSHEVALIISDHHMEPIDGITLLEVIHDLNSVIRRFLITGDQSKEVLVNAVNRGQIHGYFEKPLDFEKLKRDVKIQFQNYQGIMEEKNQLELNRAELIKLKEALYNRNSSIYETMKMLHHESEEVNVISILDRKREKLLELLDDNIIVDNLMLNRYLIIKEEIKMIISEFDIREIKIYPLILRYGLFTMQQDTTQIAKLTANMRNQLNNLSEGKTKEILSKFCFNVLNSKERFSRKDYEAYTKYVIGHIKNLLEIPFSELVNNDDVSFSKEEFGSLKDNLGYVLVIVNHVTAYSCEINPKSDVNPSLIGNLTIALTEFSSELFTKQSDMLVLEQENGILMVYRSEPGLYYVAIAYDENYYYYFLLKEFSRLTREIFTHKSETLTFTNEDLKNLNETLLQLLKTPRINIM